MEKEIRDRMHDGILDAARVRYGILPANIQLLNGFESFIYAFEKDGDAFILRLGHSRRRSPEQIQGEVDWINYLDAGGAGVARAVLSENGRLVELIPDDRNGHFLATAFVKAPGGPVWQMGGWTDDLMLAYGRLLGRIHALSKTYRLPDPAWHRGTWRDRNHLGLADILPASETGILARYRAIMAHLLDLPETADGYGMIHQDAHAGNFFVDEQGAITLFDFDDCLFGHYVYDLAMVLFYAITNRPDAADFAPRFWHRFMTGYTQETAIDPAWLAEIPYFMALREIDLYAIILRDFDDPQLDSWAGQFMYGRKARIEQGIPAIDIDFVHWARGPLHPVTAPTLLPDAPLREVAGTARQALAPLFAPLEPFLSASFLLAQPDAGRLFAEDAAAPQTAVSWLGHRAYLVGQAGPALHPAVRYTIEQTLLPALPSDGAEFILHAGAAWADHIDALLAAWEPIWRQRCVYRLDARAQDWRPALPPGYTLRPVDATLLADHAVTNLDWVVAEMVSERPSVADFLAHSVGYCVQHGSEIVAWCMSEYNVGSRCELGIATTAAHRRRGLARAAAAAVIRHLLTQGIHDVGWICWADNAASVALAESLGFRLAFDGPVWQVIGDPVIRRGVQGNLHFAANDFSRAATWYARAAAAGAPPVWLRWNAACAQARLDNPSAAFALLQQAVDAGFADVPRLQASPHWRAYRDTAAWAAILKQLGETV